VGGSCHGPPGEWRSGLSARFPANHGWVAQSLVRSLETRSHHPALKTQPYASTPTPLGTTRPPQLAPASMQYCVSRAPNFGPTAETFGHALRTMIDSLPTWMPVSRPPTSGQAETGRNPAKASLADEPRRSARSFALSHRTPKKPRTSPLIPDTNRHCQLRHPLRYYCSFRTSAERPPSAEANSFPGHNVPPPPPEGLLRPDQKAPIQSPPAREMRVANRLRAVEHA